MEHPPGRAFPAVHPSDLEEMWRGLLSSAWRSISIVPSDPGASVREVLAALTAASSASGIRVQLLDVRGVAPEGSREASAQLAAASPARRVVLLADPAARNPAGAELIRASDGILLVVRVGTLDLESLTSALGPLGADRILGSVAAPSVLEP